MELRPTRMLNQGHLRPIVVEPIRRRQTTQGRIATNSAASRIPTGGTLTRNENEPQQAGGKRPLSTHEVVRVLRRMFKKAPRASADQARLHREAQYTILKRAYSALHRWKQDGVSEKAERELRRETELAIAPRSSLPLVLIRSAFPKVDEKAASNGRQHWRWRNAIGSRRGISSPFCEALPAFLHASSGKLSATNITAAVPSSTVIRAVNRR
jgi:hypothetical protein